MKRILLLLFLVIGSCGVISAQEYRDSVKIYFRQGLYDLDLDLSSNRNSIKKITDTLKTNYSDSRYRYWIDQVTILGTASPEGSIALNRRLSEQRAKTLFDYLLLNPFQYYMKRFDVKNLFLCFKIAKDYGITSRELLWKLIVRHFRAHIYGEIN